MHRGMRIKRTNKRHDKTTKLSLPLPPPFFELLELQCHLKILVGQITARDILSALLSMTYIYTCINNTICINICHREQNGKEANVVKWEISIYDIIELKYLLLLLKSYPKSFERRRWRKEILELSGIFCTHYIWISYNSKLHFIHQSHFFKI